MHAKDSYSSFLRTDFHHENSVFVIVEPFAFYRYSFSVFTYPHDFAKVSRFWMKLVICWNLHPISNLNFRYHRFLPVR